MRTISESHAPPAQGKLMSSLSSRLVPALLLVVLAACQKATTQAKGPSSPPTVPIQAVQAARESVPTDLRVVGTVEASAIVQVRSQVAGPVSYTHLTLP